MAQLRQLANPLGLKAKDAYTLQVGLAFAGISPRDASQPLSPIGTKPKSMYDFHGVPPVDFSFDDAVFGTAHHQHDGGHDL